MAVMADKDYLEMARIIAPKAKRIFTVNVEYSRALQARELADSVSSLGIEAKAFDSYDKALAAAKGYNEKIVAFGSLYFIGEVLREL
jgi:dihydrofolate synthase/folylpolyglutamate synthase